MKKILPFLFLICVLNGTEKSQPTIMESLKENPNHFFQVERVNRPKIQEKEKTLKDILLDSPYLYGSILLFILVAIDVIIIQMLLKRARKKNAAKISLR